MHSDLKYSKDDITIKVELFQTPSLKDQAIAHWEDNLKRVKAMNWRRWTRARETTRRTAVFTTIYGNKYPHIGGDTCPYCNHYKWGCMVDDIERCPLRQWSNTDSCCSQWIHVRESLIRPTDKCRAIKAMIEYIKEKG